MAHTYDITHPCNTHTDLLMITRQAESEDVKLSELLQVFCLGHVTCCRASVGSCEASRNASVKAAVVTVDHDRVTRRSNNRKL